MRVPLERVAIAPAIDQYMVLSRIERESSGGPSTRGAKFFEGDVPSMAELGSGEASATLLGLSRLTSNQYVVACNDGDADAVGD